jgi:hypothetical protein
MRLGLRSTILAMAMVGAVHAQAKQPGGPVEPGISGAPGVPSDLSVLADQPATHTGFVFDRSMIEAARGMLGIDSERVAAALTSIGFDTYRYREPAFYTPETMDAIVHAYHAAGWKHLVGAKQTSANTAQPRSNVSDIWLHFTGGDIDRMTVLVRAPREMSVIQVAGDLRPLDLVHLSGHFGIPKVDPGAVMVPAPDGK